MLPLALALTDVHLAPGPPALVISTAAGALAVSALVLQPLLVARMRPSAGALAGSPGALAQLLGTVVLVIVLGVGHAVLTDGALDGAGTPVLLLLGAAALAAVGWAHATRPRGR